RRETTPWAGALAAAWGKTRSRSNTSSGLRAGFGSSATVAKGALEHPAVAKKTQANFARSARLTPGRSEGLYLRRFVARHRHDGVDGHGLPPRRRLLVEVA